MPRQKVDPRARQRVAQACDSCKKRKEKCNGLSPCDQCRNRCREDTCQYTKTNKASATDRNHRQSRSLDTEVRLSLTALEGELPTSANGITQGETAGLDAAPIAEDPRLLKDGDGKFSRSADK